MGNNIEENIFILKALILCVCQHRMSDTVFQSPSSSCFFMLQTCHHPASLRVSCGYETEFGPTECEWMGLGNPHSLFFAPFPLLAGCDGNLKNGFGSYVFKMAESLSAWIPE